MITNIISAVVIKSILSTYIANKIVIMASGK